MAEVKPRSPPTNNLPSPFGAKLDKPVLDPADTERRLDSADFEKLREQQPPNLQMDGLGRLSNKFGLPPQPARKSETNDQAPGSKNSHNNDHAGGRQAAAKQELPPPVHQQARSTVPEAEGDAELRPKVELKSDAEAVDEDDENEPAELQLVRNLPILGVGDSRVLAHEPLPWPGKYSRNTTLCFLQAFCPRAGLLGPSPACLPISTFLTLSYIGILPEQEDLYRAPVFHCTQQSVAVTINHHQLNDNFCDCDGGEGWFSSSEAPSFLRAGFLPWLFFT